MSSSAEAAAAAAKAPAMDAAQSATNLFELHIKVLSESYLAFFLERCALYSNDLMLLVNS